MNKFAIRMNIIIYFILFLNILLVNSTLPEENTESSGGWQQNVGQMPNQNEHQPQMDHQFQHLEDDPLLSFDFSQYSDLLASGSHENEHIDTMRIHSPQPQQHFPFPLQAVAHFNPQFVPQTPELYSHHYEQNANPHHLSHNLPSAGTSMNFDQRVVSSATGNEFVDYDDGIFQLQGFEEQQPEIDDGNEKGNGLSSRAEYEKQRRANFSGILKELRKFSDKCEKSFPILEEIAKVHIEGLLIEEKGKKQVNEKEIWKGTFFISRKSILVMESWMIKLENENRFIGMNQLLNEAKISIEELILNAKQNQKILEKYPLPFIEKKSQNIEIERKSHKRRRNKRMAKGEKEKEKRIFGYHRKRREDVNELQNVLFSALPKEFIVQMANLKKETNMETVQKYMEFLLNLLHPFKGHIQQLAKALRNSTLPGGNAESSDGGQQNVGQMSNQNELQLQMDNQIKHMDMEEDPFSKYIDILKGGIHENEYIHLLQTIPLPQNNPTPLPAASVGSSIDQRESYATSNDWKYGDLQGFEEQQPAEIDGGKGKGNGLSRAEYEKQRRINYNGILKELRKVLYKCESSFPNLRKGLSKNLKNYKGNITLRGTFSITYHCIIAMENWLIKMESELKEKRKKGKDSTTISIEELILNAQQNQKILENHPLLFNDHELNMESKMREKTHSEMEAERREKINESLKNLLSVFPKGFIIQMTNFLRETIVETSINYMEFLFNLLDPFMGHIWQTKGIIQNEQNMEEIGPESSSRKRQRNGD